MNDSSERFRFLGFVAAAVIAIAALITFSGPNFLIHGTPDPFHGNGLLFTVFYSVGLLGGIGLILRRKWARYIFAAIVLVALVRSGFMLRWLAKGLLYPETGFVTTFIQDDGRRFFKLIVTPHLESTCEGIRTPLWSFTVEKDVMSLKPLLSFRIAEKGTDAHGNRFLDDSGVGIPIKLGKLLIISIDKQKVIRGMFDVSTKNGRSIHSFRAVWCREENEREALEKGKEEHEMHLR